MDDCPLCGGEVVEWPEGLGTECHRCGWMRGQVGNWKFFTDQEVMGLNGNLPAMLDMAHGLSNQAISEATGGAIRYVEYILTFTTGGQHCGNSAHYKGLAVDIGLGHLAEGFQRDMHRWAIMNGLHKAGFKRIENAPAHIHVDIGEAPLYAVPCEWIGKDQ